MPISAPNATDLHLMDGTLAKPATFEAWKVPAKSFVQRFGSGWTFRVPKGQSATAVARLLFFYGWNSYVVFQDGKPIARGEWDAEHSQEVSLDDTQSAH